MTIQDLYTNLRAKASATETARREHYAALDRLERCEREEAVARLEYGRALMLQDEAKP